MKKWISVLLAAAMCAALAGCNSGASSSGSASGSSSDASSGTSEASTIDYSAGLDDKGYFEGVTALDYVTLPADYNAIPLSEADVAVDESYLDSYIDSIAQSFATDIEITDRAVEEGDSVNIDYTGSIDGVEFDGGSTGGSGTVVTAGGTGYIDDFLDQIIGHEPGETFDVNVTFPDPYENNPDLAGKDAVFVTTINHIVEQEIPEMTDEFVKENLYETDGWETVEQMRTELADAMRETNIYNGVWNYLMENCEISEVPEAVTTFQQESVLNEYRMYATSYGMELEDFISAMGMESTDAVLESAAATIESYAKQALITQAIAEKEAMDLTHEDVVSYFAEVESATEDTVTQYEEYFGAPYVMMNAVNYYVGTFLIDSAVVA